MEFSSFVANATKKLFTRFSINTNFLSKNPTTWNNDPGYKSGLEKLQKTVVVNDVADRGVKLIQEYNNILTKDETEKQFVLQIVNENRKNYPSATKYSQEKIIFMFQDSQFLRLVGKSLSFYISNCVLGVSNGPDGG